MFWPFTGLMVEGGGGDALITTALLYHVGHVVSTLWQGYVPAAYKSAVFHFQK